ncbi:coronin-1A-like [Actinia tenebrosa]|uniref:Coronin n=1 Tax=Actinia tenebrosa TaxID=6105 RepID=A0A6P8HXL0_ACTTE|nr:coronin-1A-like [Actinia tenebrosa]
MSRVVRKSLFRHVFGKDPRKEETFEDIKVSKNSWEAPFCAVNPKFVAVCLASAGGGAFLVLPLSKTGRVELNSPRVAGHQGDVLDLAWNPFNDNMIASSSEDMKVMLWEIPDTGLAHDLTTPLVTLSHHQRRVGIVRWHPTAENILLSASHDNLICVWNLESGEIVTEIDCHPDTIFCVAWNHDGSKIATTCKDKKLRILDPRSGDVVKKCEGHEGSKPQQIAFCSKTDNLFTTGFSRMSERQYAIWDKNLEQLTLEDIDSSNGVQFIRYDPDTNMIWLIGKGDCLIRYYELVDEEPYCHWITNYQGKDPQRGFGFMPKRGCNISINEICRIYRMTGKGHILPVSFTVPRKSEMFQEDLFPPTQGGDASLTADEWLGGKNAEPKLMSLEALFKGKGQAATTAKKSTGLSSLKGKLAAKKTKGGAAGQEEDMDVNKLLDTLKKLNNKVEKLEKSNAELENRVTDLETVVAGEDNGEGHDEEDDDK